jgi:hypothetical protein
MAEVFGDIASVDAKASLGANLISDLADERDKDFLWHALAVSKEISGRAHQMEFIARAYAFGVISRTYPGGPAAPRNSVLVGSPLYMAIVD